MLSLPFSKEFLVFILIFRNDSHSIKILSRGVFGPLLCGRYFLFLFNLILINHSSNSWKQMDRKHDIWRLYPK